MMDPENKIFIYHERREEFRQKLNTLSQQGKKWVGWHMFSAYVQPDELLGFSHRREAEAFCRAAGDRRKAVHLQGFIDQYDQRNNLFHAFHEAVPITIDLNDIEHADAKRSLHERRVESMQLQLSRLGIEDNDLVRKLDEGVKRNEEKLRLPVYMHEDHHPLRVDIVFGRTKHGAYRLQQLEVSGIEIMSGIVENMNLQDLEIRMSLIDWSARHKDTKQWARMEPIIQELEKLQKYSFGQDIVARLWLKYANSTYMARGQPYPDPKRGEVEKRSIFPWNEKDPITIKEACEAFLGKSGQSMPERLLQQEMTEGKVVELYQENKAMNRRREREVSHGKAHSILKGGGK